ncbi:uncharacterized protein ISCGN_016541 [Ixodes scapularis]
MATASAASSPWPGLNKYFELTEAKDDNLIFKFLLCQPQLKLLSCAKSSSSNLKKHVKKLHKQSLAAFEALSTKKRGIIQAYESPGANSTQPTKQAKIDDLVRHQSVPQVQLDRLVEDFVINATQPFSVVEEPSFVKLLKATAPERNVLTRPMLMTRLKARFDALKDSLRSTFQKLQFVAVTADCWTRFHRCYLGVTVLWLDPTTLERKVAALACRRMHGSVTFERLATTLEEIFNEFDLLGKITKVITDSGSNFVKAFRIYGEEEANDEDEENCQPVHLCSLIESAEEGRHRLPPHHRCSAHTLNLIATVDAARAETVDQEYSTIKQSVFSKCQKLWNKQGQSAQAADLIKSHCGIYVPRPNVTRWNSTFKAMEAINTFLERGTDLDVLFCKLGIPRLLPPHEPNFIKEYCRVMKPVCCALNVLQGDNHIHSGYLLPTLDVLIKKIEYEKMAGLRYCGPLAVSLLAGIHKRFDNVMSQKDLLVAATLLPRFKLSWISDEAKRNAALAAVKSELTVSSRLVESPASPLKANAAEEDFFGNPFGNACTSVSGDDELSRYFLVPHNFALTELKNSFPLMHKLFLKVNTAVPSSASVERLFSVGADVFTKKRGRMSDANFEIQLLLKYNSGVCFG